jgi:hypothetical protein
MSAFYDQASLVVVPSGYKSGKIYAQKPLTTDGQLTFTRASTATRVNASGLIETVSSGVPRLDYLGSTCPRLLLEPQRTNLGTYSEQFNDSSWSKLTMTVSANAALSPDGNQNADKIYPSVSGTAFIYKSLAGSGTQTISFFVKAGGKNFCWLLNASGSVSAFFNLANGTVATNPTGTAKIESFGNGWYRVSETTSSVTGNYLGIGSSDSASNDTSIANGTDGIFIWGAQNEAGAYATSYIPTTSAAVTRLVDSYSRSLSNIAAGTAFINITDNVAQSSPGTHVYGPFYLSAASLGLYLSKPNNNRLRLWTEASATVYQTTQTNLKLAVTWDGTNVNVYENGVKVVTNFAYALTNVNNMASSGALETSAKIAEILLFNSVLSEAKLIELTTP